MSRSHVAAGLGAAPADLGALLHLRVIAEGFAGLGAPLAGFGTKTASPAMQRRVSQHEVGADPARIRAIQKRLDVCGCDMLTALAEAVGQRFQADVVAVAAVFDAFLHVHLSYSCSVVAKLPLDRSAAKKPEPPPIARGRAVQCQRDRS